MKKVISIVEDEKDLNEDLKKDNCSFVFLKFEDADMMIGVVNLTNDTIKVSEGTVFELDADKYDLYGYSDDDKPLNVILPKNIIVNKSTAEDVITAYGEPTEIRDGENFKYLAYELTDSIWNFYTQMEITIDKETNLVYGFEYGNMPE